MQRFPQIVLAAVLLTAQCSAGSAQTYTPNDPQYYETPEYYFSGALQSIHASTAYSMGYTGAGSTIAMLDLGFDTQRPDLAGQFSYVDNSPLTGLTGYSLATQLEHGTAVAAAAAGNRNGSGMQGVAYNASLIGLAQSLSFGIFSPPTNLTLFQRLLPFKPTVINNSWTYDLTSLDDVRAQAIYPTDRYQAFAQATYNVHPRAYWVSLVNTLQQLEKNSVIVFANTNDPTQTQVSSLTGMPLLFPQLAGSWIAVVNVDGNTDTLISGACGDAAQFCIGAMGHNVNLATAPGGFFDFFNTGYAVFNGSSFATPQVSGAVAIAHQIYPNATPAQLTSIVLQSARDIGAPGVDRTFGWGMLDLANLANSGNPAAANMFAGAAWARFAALDHVGQILQQRMAFQQKAPAATQAGDPKSAMSSPFGAKGHGFWFKGLHGSSGIDGGSLAQGYDASTNGVLLGLDLPVTPDMLLGAAVGWSTTGFNARTGGDSGSITGTHLAVYGDWTSSAWFAHGTAQLEGFGQSTVRRNIPGAVGTSVPFVGQGSTSGLAAAADFQAGRAFDVRGGARIAPYLSAGYRWQRSDAFTETGAGAFSLTVGQASLAQSHLGFGVNVTTAPIDIGRLRADLTTDVSYARVFGDRSFDTSAQMLGNTLTGQTQKVGADTLRWGVKLRLSDKTGTVQGDLAYSGQFQKYAMTSRFSAGLNVLF